MLQARTIQSNHARFTIRTIPGQRDTSAATLQAWLEIVNTSLWMLIATTVVSTLLSSGGLTENDLRSTGNSVSLPIASVNLLADCLLFLLILPVAKEVWATFVSLRPLAMYAVLSLTSTFWSVNSSISLRRGGYLLVYVIGAAYFGTRFTLKQVARIATSAAVVLALLSCIAYVVYPAKVLDPSHLGEWRGLTSHKNVFGQFISFGLCSLVLVDFGNLALLRPLLIGLMVCLLYLSHSTTSWLLFVICVASIPFFLTLSRTRTLAVPLLVLSTAILSIIGLLSLPVTGKLMQVLGKDPTLTGRTDLWVALLQAAAKRPLLGYGYEAFFGTPGLMIGLQSHAGWLPPHAHNGYLQVLISTGAMGCALTVWFILDYLITAIRFAQRNQTKTSLIPLVCIVFWLIHNAVEVSLMQGQSFPPFINFALYAAMKVHPYESTPEEPQPLEPVQSRRTRQYAFSRVAAGVSR